MASNIIYIYMYMNKCTYIFMKGLVITNLLSWIFFCCFNIKGYDVKVSVMIGYLGSTRPPRMTVANTKV